MKVVIYACVPVKACNGLYRRVRIVMDGTKVTSIQEPDQKWDHGSCYHTPTVNEYMDESPDVHLQRAVREHFSGVRYNLPSLAEECPLC
jgi:hypothetical protein